MSLSATEPPVAVPTTLGEAQALIVQQQREIERLREEVLRLEHRLGGEGRSLSAVADGGEVVSVLLASGAAVDEWLPKVAAEAGKDLDSISTVDCFDKAFAEGSPAGVFWTLLLRAVLAGDRVTSEELLRGACGAGELSAVRWLVQHGSAEDVRSADGGGRIPLHCAAAGGQLSVVRWLVEEHGGAAADDVSRPDNDGYTPFHLACRNGDLDVVQWLVQHGGAAADVSRPNNNGITPLYLACRHGYLAVVQWLVQHGGAAADDVSRPNSYGSTPLLSACRNGHLAVVQWLVEEHGGAAADISRPNNDGNTPLCLACCHGHLALVQWLVEEHGGAAADVSRPNNDDNTPLHLTCRNGHLAVVRWLVEEHEGAAADVSRPNNRGNTPLHLACRHGYLAVVQWLVQHGGAAADVSRPNSYGMTSFLLTLKAPSPRFNIAHCLLLACGIDALDHDGTLEQLRDPAVRQPVLRSVRDAVAVRHSFKRVVLVGMLEGRSPHLSKLYREAGLRRLVGCYVGVASGVEYRNLRYALVALRCLGVG